MNEDPLDIAVNISEESKDSVKVINNLYKRKLAFSQEDENQRNQRKRLNFLEEMNIKSMSQRSKFTEHITINTQGQETPDEIRSIQSSTNLQPKASLDPKYKRGSNDLAYSNRDLLSSKSAQSQLPMPIPSNDFNVPNADGIRAPLLHRDLVLRAQMQDHLSRLNKNYQDGNCLQESNSGKPILASRVFTDPYLTATNLPGSYNNMARNVLVHAKHEGNLYLDETVCHANTNQEAIIYGQKSFPSSFIIDNRYERNLALLSQEDLSLRKKELASRLKCPHSASLSYLHPNSTEHPQLQHTSNAPMPPPSDSKDAIDGWHIGYQAGLNQGYLNIQRFLTETTAISPPIRNATDRYHTCDLDDNTDSRNEPKSFIPQPNFLAPSTEIVKLKSKGNAGKMLLPPCQEDPLPYFSKRLVVTLATDEDENWLTEFFCFVRSDLIEVFRASNSDVISRVNTKSVDFGQIGIRCRYCAHRAHCERASRSSCYPSSINRIYQSITMMIHDHFLRCHTLPNELKTKFTTLKSQTGRGAVDSKKYWIKSAKQLGMVDTTPNQGIMVTEASITAIQS